MELAWQRGTSHIPGEVEEDYWGRRSSLKADLRTVSGTISPACSVFLANVMEFSLNASILVLTC